MDNPVSEKFAILPSNGPIEIAPTIIDLFFI